MKNMTGDRTEKFKSDYHYLPIIIGIVLVILAVFIRFSRVLEKGQETVLTSSTLINAMDIAELSTAKFDYNGIAEKHKTDKKGEELEAVVWRVKYNGTVKAGIKDISEIRFEIDNEGKTIKPILPEIMITANTVDEKSLSFIPSDVEVTVKDALQLCEEDINREAQTSLELKETAENQLKAVIEAMILPIVDANGYRVIWD